MKVFFRTTSNTTGKHRPEWFSYKKCFENFSNEFKDDDVTIFFDGDCFEIETDFKIVYTKAGSETKSFKNLIEYIRDQNYDDDEIIYIVEDDYIHKEGASKVLKEAFEEIPNVYYVTLYDNYDKYTPYYYERYAPNFPIQILISKSVHWRTTPSTTNTFACRLKTLKEDFDIHERYSPDDKMNSDDHLKFITLWNKGRNVISCVPGYSTHVENVLMSPCVNWESHCP